MGFEKRGDLDYLQALKALKIIPFAVGRILLADFLKGKMNNKSIIKHDMDEMSFFGSLSGLKNEDILEMIDNLIINNLIEVFSIDGNKFMKVLKINIAGKKELKNPSLNNKRVSNGFHEPKTEINEDEKKEFEKYNGFLEDYNSYQKKAIISDSEKILCVAGAGSGKTTVLTKRIEFLIKYKNVNPAKILAITFTKKAKEEMKTRLNKLGIFANVETFNSYCEKILIKYSKLIYSRRVKVISYSDKIFSVSSALHSSGKNWDYVFNNYFSKSQKANKNKNKLQAIFINDCFDILDYFKLKGFEDFSDFSGEDNSELKMVYEVVEFLKEYMEVQGFRTYFDQVNDVVKFFQENKDFISDFDHILVDEFQDVNSLQVLLLDLLNSKNLFCVGDPRQSIFGWRGSDINYILNFSDKYNGAEVIGLKKNYRSNNHVVDLMNKCISSMNVCDLTYNFEGERHLKLCEFDNIEEEMDFIVRKISMVNVPREEIFVIARTNKQLIDLSKKLSNIGIDFVLKTDDFPNVEVERGKVVLSTIHSIKGLEAELVFVLGCNSFNFPCKSSEHPVMEAIKIYDYDKEEEEKRLFYVAISRAKNMLYLTYSKKPTKFINNRMKKLMDKIEFNKNI